MIAIGIMTGTSMDGIDIGVIRTDGMYQIDYLDYKSQLFPPSLVFKIKSLISGETTIKNYREIEKEYTEYCYHSIQNLLEKYDVDVIGFHGQSLYHAPQDKITHQMGYYKYLHKLSGIEVVFDIRTDDILYGREGAPLVPIFHKAAIKEQYPFAALNIGGVSNITFIGQTKSDENDIVMWTDEYAQTALAQDSELRLHNLIGFDTGPGNAPINDLMYKYFNQDYDKDGAVARSGTPDMALVERLMNNEYFEKTPPKSLDRNHFDYSIVNDLDPKDKVATITHFVAKSIASAYKYLPAVPNVTYLCGGGRHNKFLFELLQQMFHVKHIDSIGLNGDMLEAYAFAYLAVRKKLGLYCGSV